MQQQKLREQKKIIKKENDETKTTNAMTAVQN